ncbi:ATP-dependent helicase/DNAse subunit B [Marinococcus luteus]|uniref:ATP-dependent helicase/DNAse subunit B n=1 Tax=Marinococcus luteus TaxID=1122204 RepID=A0A1H2QGG0_9BACI|nr:PD-(D/E)XK nuclease family protein [Marinococcus luteus]SDW06241.1 ATP-dependent helicase/DNAse subunit B [Marinococcus luteus]
MSLYSTSSVLIVSIYLEAEAILAYLKENSRIGSSIEVKTTLDIAYEILLETKHDPFSLLNSANTGALIESLIMDTNSNNRFQYFKNINISNGFVKAMHQVVSELRLDGWNSANFPSEDFVSDEKAEDLRILLEDYEKKLAKNHWFEEARVYSEAIEAIEKNGLDNNHTYYISPTKTCSFLETCFIKHLKVEGVKELPLYEAAAVDRPKLLNEHAEWNNNNEWKDFWGDSSPAMNMQLYRSVTKEVEIKEAFQQIHQNTTTAEQTLWLFPENEAYENHLAQFLDAKNVPYTSANGFSAIKSTSGQLIQGISHWLNSQYSASEVCSMLREGIIDIKHPNKIAALLEKADIRWGKQQYEKKLNDFINSLEDEREIKQARKAKRFIRSFFKYIPEEGIEIGQQEFIQSIIQLINKNSKAYSAFDEVSKQKIIEYLQQTSEFNKEVATSKKLLNELVESLVSLKVLASGPKAGYLHLAPFSKGLFVQRNNVHFFGMDQSSVPGQVKEDPLLLDKEREALGDSLPTSKEKMTEKTFWITQLLLQQQGKNVGMSYTTFDTIANRSVFPSSFFLQAFRNVYQLKNASLKEMENNLPVLEQTSENTTVEENLWRKALKDQQHVQIGEDAHELYPSETAKQEQRQAREREILTEHDGNVPLQEDAYDPRANNELAMSAGKLELLGKCSYAYFLNSVLKVNKKEVRDFDPSVWLDEAERGTLLHELYETFVNKSFKKQSNLSWEEFSQLAEERVEEWKIENPPPSEHVFERTKQTILRACYIFYQNEQENVSTRVEAVEYSFGINEDNFAKIPLLDGTAFQLRGKIDRIEKASEQRLRVIDYKSGKPRRYSISEPYKGGRMLQHYLYAKALENLIDSEEIVVESGYYFPTDRGYGETAIHEVTSTYEEQGENVLNQMLNIVKHGDFVMTDDPKDCNFCDYATICKRDHYDANILKKKSQDDNAAGVRAYREAREVE